VLSWIHGKGWNADVADAPPITAERPGGLSDAGGGEDGSSCTPGSHSNSFICGNRRGIGDIGVLSSPRITSTVPSNA
jgi:hypothetical protein